MANNLSNWIMVNFGVVHHRDDGGRALFPGFARPVAPDVKLSLSFRPIGDSGNPLVLAPEIRETSFFNPTLAENRLGFGGVQSDEPYGKRSLEKWDPSNPDVVNQYLEWERDLHLNLSLRSGEVADPTLLLRRQRLEGVVGVLHSTGQVFWDRIQIFRVRDALKDTGPDGTYDWVAYKISPVPGNPVNVQEGGGHGPPDLK